MITKHLFSTTFQILESLNSKTILFLTIGICFMLNSCSDNDSDANLGNGNTMYADASTQFIEFIAPFGNISDFDNSIIIVASSCDKQIGIDLSFPIYEGVHNISDEDVRASLHWGGCFKPLVSSWDITYSGVNGTITVTELNEERVSGTFNFEGEDYNGNLKSVNNGFFDIEF